MKKYIVLIIIILTCFTGCEKGKSKQETVEKTKLKTVSEQFLKEFDECKKNDYDNLDFSECVVKNFNLNQCTDLELDISGKKVKSGDELCRMFENYCKFYFGEFDESAAFFSCNMDDNLHEKDTSLNGRHNDDEKYAWYPSYEKYKSKIKKGDLYVNSFLYRNIKEDEYLWWIVGSSSFPCWINRGNAYSSFKTEETKITSWLPSDILQKEESMFNDGTYDEVSYNLGGEQVSIGDAVSYFEEKYLETLPYDIQKGYSLSVSDIDVVKLKNNQYAYVLSYSQKWNSIPYDMCKEYYSEKDNSSRFTSSGQAVMTGKSEVDMITDFSFVDVKETKKYESVLSLTDGIHILNEKLTQGVKFQIQKIEVVYQGKYNEDFSKAHVVPSWKFTAYNSNDNMYYCFYVNLIDGKFDFYSYSPLGE